MNTNDKKLSAALSADEKRLIEEMPDYDNIFVLMSRSFRSAMRPFVITLIIMTTAVTAFCVYSLVQVFNAETTQNQILWSVATLGSGIWVGLAKVWYWMQLERQKLLMELKRAELRILDALASRDAA